MLTLAWNLAHQVKVRPIPDDFVEVILPPVRKRFSSTNTWTTLPRAFKAAMRKAGFLHQAVSATPARHNQIFAASKHAFTVGDLRPPQFDGFGDLEFPPPEVRRLPVRDGGPARPGLREGRRPQGLLGGAWADHGVSTGPAPSSSPGHQLRSLREGEAGRGSASPLPLRPRLSGPESRGAWSYLAHSGRATRSITSSTPLE